jgi:hypothetical protein
MLADNLPPTAPKGQNVYCYIPVTRASIASLTTKCADSPQPRRKKKKKLRVARSLILPERTRA